MTLKTSAEYWEALSAELGTAADFEDELDILRRFTRRENLALRDKDLAKSITLTELFQGLTSVAEAVVQGSLTITQKEIFQGSSSLDGAFAIIAMGKFGGREITYHSDLDIIYLYEKLSDQERATRLGHRIISGLTLLTREGSAYPIDTALRPSGNRGTLVSTLDSFREYHSSMGRTWERQALIKARPLLGDSGFLNDIQVTFTQTSYRHDDAPPIAREIHDLRLRMEKELAKERLGTYNIKTGRGGLIDIEFAAQFLQLIHGLDHPEIRTTGTLEALQTLDNSGILEKPLAKSLSDAYLFYRELETRIRLVLERSCDEVIAGKDWLKTVEERFFPGENVIERYLNIREIVRTNYLGILGVKL